MPSILENKQALQDLRNDMEVETKKGHDMLKDNAATLEMITAQSDKLDLLEAKATLIQRDIEREESDGRKDTESAAKNQKPKSMFSCAGEYFKAVHDSDAPGGLRDKRLSRVVDAATGGSEGTNADGGYLVPPEYADGIIDLVEGESVLFPQARRVQIAGNRLIEMYLNETDRKDPVTGSRHGGILAYWKGEAAQYEAVKAAFGERTTNLHKLTAYCPVTEELLEDYPAMEGVLNDLVGREFGFKADDAILNGTGNGMPLGILATHSSNTAQNNAALVTIAKEVGQAANTIVTENILKMHNALIASKRKNACWYINQDLEMVLMKLLMNIGSISSTGAGAVEGIAGSIGMPIYTPPGAYGNAEARLLNIPVKPIEHCAELGDKGDIVLMDASQYLVIERSGIMRQSSMHVRFDYDETVFKFSWRLGGRPDWMKAITAYKGNTARSPYIALANRA